MSHVVPRLGWGTLLLTALAAAAAGPGGQLVYAAATIGLVGLPHGASDLAIVPARRRPSFLLAYLGCVGGALLLWRVSPGAGLALLLAASAIHFAVDADGRPPLAAWSLGALLVGGPALLHAPAVAQLLEASGADAATSLGLARVLVAAGLAGTGGLVLAAARGKLFLGPLDLAGCAALLLLPPLVGFATGFVLIHARGQTSERQRALGCATLGAYLRAVAPLLAGAAAVVALAGLAAAPGPALLFAGIAALALPHMVVTPLWRRGGLADRVPRGMVPALLHAAR